LDTDIFFPASDSEAGAAKAVCAECPVRDQCLEWAIATRQEEGIWGGMTDGERRRLRRRRRDAARRAAAASAA
jgi:WhiB family redox-sensing transcriptional regulator